MDTIYALPHPSALNLYSSWEFDPAVKPKLVENIYIAEENEEKPAYHLIDGGLDDFSRVFKLYSNSPVKGYEIARIQAIANDKFSDAFKATLSSLDQRSNFPKTYAPTWSYDPSSFDLFEFFSNDSDEEAMRQLTHTHLRQISYPPSGCKHAKIVWGFHGTKGKALHSICSTNFDNLAKTDGGYFGKGIYQTSSAEYAYRYAQKEVFSNDGILLMSCISFVSAYPIIHHPDIENDAQWNKIEYSEAAKKKHWRYHCGGPKFENYDAHYVLVTSEDDIGLTYLPIRKNQKYDYDEIVVFNSAQILPRYVITLQPTPMNTKVLPLAPCQVIDLSKLIVNYLPTLTRNPTLARALVNKMSNYSHENLQRLLRTDELEVLGHLRFLGNNDRRLNFLVAEKAQGTLINLIETNEKKSKRKEKTRLQIIEALKANYTNPQRITTRLDSATVINDIYTSPIIIPKIQQETDDEPNINIFEENLTGLWETADAIPLSELFVRTNPQKKRAIMLGSAGIGKSCFCEFIARQWGDEKLWSDQFEAIFWVRLRELQNISPHETTSSFLRSCTKSDDLYYYDIDEYVKANKQRILFILDGLDEVPLHKEKNSIQLKLLNDLLDYPHWILTSRPHALPNIKLQDCIVFENKGFTPEMIASYVHKSIGGEKADSVLEKIHRNPRILNLCRIPLNLEMICAAQNGTAAEIASMHNMTDIYQQLTLHLKRRFLERLGKPSPENWQEEDFEKDVELKRVFHFLEQAAWVGLTEGRILFSFSDGALKACFDRYLPGKIEDRCKFFDDVHASGFLQSTGLRLGFLDNQYSFLHLTFQEFFAARYLARLLKKGASNWIDWGDKFAKASQMITQIYDDPRYKIIILFIAGLLKRDASALNHFFKLQEKPKTGLSGYCLILFMRCKEEIGDFNFLNVDWITYLNESTDWEHFVNFIRETVGIDHECTKKFISTIEKALNHKDVEIRRKVSRGLSLVKKADLKELLPLLKAALNDSDNEVRSYIILTLGSYWQNDSSIFPTLIEILSSPRNTTLERKAIIDSLGSMRQAIFPIAPHFAKLACGDPDDHVRAHAMKALGRFWQTYDPVIPLLSNVLTNSKCTVIEKEAAISTLEQIGQEQGDKVTIIPQLENVALMDPEGQVRSYALFALGSFWKIHDPILPLLLKTFSNAITPFEKEAALITLGRIGKVGLEVIPLIEKAYFSCNFETVVSALAKIGHAYPEIPPPIAFGKDKWNAFFGADVGVEPPLPADIHEILASPCPLISGKTIAETHFLVLIPKTVNGAALNSLSLEKLSQRAKVGPSFKYFTEIRGDNNKPPEDPDEIYSSHWVLFSHRAQKKSRKYEINEISYSFNQKKGANYRLPSIMEALVCISVAYCSTGNLFYLDHGTWCNEQYSSFFDLDYHGKTNYRAHSAVHISPTNNVPEFGWVLSCSCNNFYINSVGDGILIELKSPK